MKIEDALNPEQKERFWAAVHEDFSRLKSDPTAWQAYQDEIALFDGASMDGLENEPPYYTPEEEEDIRAEHARFRHGGDLGR
jgi:hypothetical protein